MLKSAVSSWIWRFLGRDVTKDCENCLKAVKAICQDTKVLQTTFKLLHHIIFTRRELACCNIVSDANCIYCEQDDSIEHCLFQCPSVLDFISSSSNWFDQITNRNVVINNHLSLGSWQTMYKVKKWRILNFKKNHFITYLRYFIIVNKVWDKQLITKEFQNNFQSYCKLHKIDRLFWTAV